MLEIVATARNNVEAQLLRGRLSEAGIQSMQGGGRGGGWGASPTNVYVEQEDLERAREVLEDNDNGFSEEELARLSDEAGQEAVGGDSASSPNPGPPGDRDTRAQPDRPVSSPEPKRHGFLKALEKLGRSSDQTDAPNDPLGR